MTEIKTDENTRGESLIEAFRRILREKQGYAVGMTATIQERLDRKTISPLTVQSHRLALDNLDASQVSLDKSELYNALHFFSRACANLGELIGRAEKEKKSS